MLVGLWIGYYRPPAAPAISTSEHDPSSRIPANLKWCDAEHKVPYIAAAACGGGSSCERASSSLEMDDHTDWTAFCAHLTQQLTQ